MFFLHDRQEFGTIDPRHAHVGNDDIGFRLCGYRQGAFGVMREAEFPSNPSRMFLSSSTKRMTLISTSCVFTSPYMWTFYQQATVRICGGL
jgi:hypothetical protein